MLNIGYIYWAVNIGKGCSYGTKKTMNSIFNYLHLSDHRKYFYFKYIFHQALFNRACVTITTDLGNLPRIIFIRINRKRATEHITFWLEIDLLFIFVWLTLHMKRKTKDQKDAIGRILLWFKKGTCMLHKNTYIIIYFSTAVNVYADVQFIWSGKILWSVLLMYQFIKGKPILYYIFLF